jgi:hypothetical protein
LFGTKCAMTAGYGIIFLFPDKPGRRSFKD